jgi:hypothetical protein
VDGQVRVTPGALVAVKAPLPASALAERAQVNGEPVNGEPVRDQKAEQKP